METKHIILFTLVNLVYLIQAASTTGAESFLELNANEPVCTASGVRCHKCWTSMNCIDLGNSTFHLNLQYCSMGRSCKTETGYCEPDGNYDCSELDKLQCNNMEGIFPSPFNNMEYFTCVRGSANTLLKYISKCSSSYKFDPAKKLCRRKVKGVDSISSLVPVCKFENETGPIKSNPNIFYRCEKETVDVGFNFVPQIYGCDFNLMFDGNECVESEFLTYFDENEKCFRSGSFAHPADCKKYYYCENIGSLPKVKSCPQYHKFEQSYGYCYNRGSNSC